MPTRLLKAAAAALLLACSLCQAQTPYTEDSTFRGLGGKPGIQRIVQSLLTLAQADARISDSFLDFDLEQLAQRLAEQLCEFSGGPCTYTGKYKERDMESVHADLNISQAQFNALAEDLQLAMEREGVPARVQNKLLAKLAPMQRAIVTR